MDTDALRWFQQVADGATVTEVSELEGVTQSGVSRALQRLEQQAGTPLLRRSGRILRMTQAGAVFKRHVDTLLHQLDDGIAAVHELTEPDTGTIVLAFQQSLGTWLVPELIASFRAAHPRVRFRLTQIHDEPDTAPLDHGRADLEIGTRRPPDPALSTRRLAVEPLRLAMPGRHPLAQRPDAGLPDAAGEPFVCVRAGRALRALGDELCERAGFRPDVVFEGEDLTTVRGLVGAGLGLAIVPAPRAGTPESAPGPVAYRPIADPRAERDICLSWAAGRRLLQAAELFRQHAIRQATRGRFPAPVH
jgi:LysR family transcriptional regulator, transcription activator of glutamate synthase operon